MSRPEFRHAAFHGKVGIARSDITPPIGIYARNWGAARHDLAESIHRPLTLTAMMLTSLTGESRQVLVDADLGWWKTPQVFQQFQTRLLQELSLASEQLIFALTHTHSAPPLMERDDSLPGADLLHAWTESLLEITIRTVRQAAESSTEAILDWQTGGCGLAASRDFADPAANGNTAMPRYLCGYNPEGTPDNTLILGRLSDLSGRMLGTLVNYACHPTTLAWQNRAISPDYIGSMRETVEHVTGAPALFLLGACGELAPRDQYVEKTSVADAHGRELGYAALSTLFGMEPSGTRLVYAGVMESGAPLAVWQPVPDAASTDLQARRTYIDLPLKNWLSADELEQQRRDCTDRALEERLRRKRDIRRSIGDGQHYALPITCWKIGDAILIGSCCEAYSILQQELRSRFPGRTIICMNLINGSLGYLPPRALYNLDIYPVWQTPFDRGSLELTLAAMEQAVHNILS